METCLITIEQLPKALIDKLNETIERHPTVRKLRNRIEMCQRKGDYVGMAQARADISRIQKTVEEEYIKQNSVITKRIESFRHEMNDEDQERMSINANMVILLSDMLETCCVEINEIVGKYQSEYRVEMFDDIIRLGKACSEQMKWMSEQTDMFYQLTFAEVGDNLTMMIKNKVKSLLRKVHSKRKQPNMT